MLIDRVNTTNVSKVQLGQLLHFKPDDLNIEEHNQSIPIQTKRDLDLLFKRDDKNKDLTLHPTTVEELLQISKVERKRWTREGKLKVVEYRDFYKWGKTNQYPVYDPKQITQISSTDIERWRSEHKEVQHIQRKLAAQKAILTRKSNQTIHQHFYNKEWDKLLYEWNQIDCTLAATFQLAFWTSWINRWAKEYQQKQSRARTKVNEYRTKKEYYYQLKKLAVEHLVKSDYANLSFYKPSLPDKVLHLELCPSHYELWCQIREFGFYTKSDFFKDHSNLIKKCNHCALDTKKDYYSLYYITISDNRLKDYQFSFHIPYPIGKLFLPDFTRLNRIQHQEQEGMFRFGRAIEEEEKIIFREKEVIKYFDEAKEKYQLFSSPRIRGN